MASSFTKELNNNCLSQLDFNDNRDFEDAQRGFIGTIEDGIILTKEGNISYSMKSYDFLKDKCPDTVNPSLWRQCQLNRIHGLFEVLKDKIYQIRGFDISNMTFVRGEKGWIVIDTLTTVEASSAGLSLFRKHCGELPITAIIITHSHGDHCGGFLGVGTDETKVYVPPNLINELISENIFAGPAMDRRSIYMYGQNLTTEPTQFVGNGLGQQLSHGLNAFPKYSQCIEIKGEQEIIIDGINFHFIETPGAEAPSEFVFYIPSMKAFCASEEINHIMHNLITLRGAKVRNGKLWANYIDHVIEKFGDDVEINFGSHHWPTWGNKRVNEYWEKQRDLYKFIHDQTLRYANLGYTPNEIVNLLKLPDSLAKEFYCRDYYGSLSHNIKGEYQLYIGWYDGNPAHLDQLQPSDLGKKYVEALGGEDKVLDFAQKAFDKGEYKWAVELLNHLVFTNPNNEQARLLLANVYTQMAFSQECAVWRNIYLSGAHDLRREPITMAKSDNLKNPYVLRSMNLTHIFDTLCIMVDPSKLIGADWRINLFFDDVKENYCVIVKNCVVNIRNNLHKQPTFTAHVTRELLLGVFAKKVNLQELVQSGKIQMSGNPMHLFGLFASIGVQNHQFNIIEP
ncbi:metallo-beta-lactamase superfamily protein [Entamoeba histolytica HM-1:IMSS-B]|uniref:Metallo-beta-lactamase superfamily protein n=6 Tax=Entamoeba histolytica TaxID=5759 RepID=C4M148_ENTH1|nr:metallo-beta-lactamase superfamily protein [Entamoeba histolytica HM-1:IMSS]EMD45600.1 metallobeta-lactamase superfamily protein [Entamoeba histolytica KU27]EMH76305.1 metallo-beta-lactamase superfamily protein [Entamoeba histolytica HM-1:IMSS-B]EMS12563.1 metallo-beta-lactamase superfamily protein [Entamoeba histolytica HM-3:IMSS]ENY62337.1 metallo-beta-lactamase superfamily protein, putative [Entamoeba histolytica HM-1:IMSS-A]GAT94921.1 metallo-beta-lactamase superfamily protein [Entamoeb|eukprot:XP_650664.1 metallo-beta-lactamase superfamily protein [Entamoeba histolytica HM-1:IMSS]